MTTENRRADARIEAAAIAMHDVRRDLAKGIGDLSFDMDFAALPDEIKDVDRALARAAILAASLVEQPAAAPEKCAGCVARCTNNPPDCYAAPSPADERAAFDLTDMEWLEVFERVSASIPNVFGSYMKAGAAFAREAIRMANAARVASATAPPERDDPAIISTANRGYAAGLADRKVLGALASASETGAEGAPKDRARWFVRDFSRDVGFAMSDMQREVMLNLFLRYASPSRSPAMAAEAVSIVHDNTVDARVARLRVALEGECDGLHVDYHRAKAILAYLDDDGA